MGWEDEERTIATFTDAPGNGVQDPEESSQTSAHEESSFDISAISSCLNTGFPD